VHARVCVRLCASACCPVLTASLHPSAACRPSGAWMAPTDYLTTFAPATVSGVLETASAYSIDRANLLVGACFPIILPPLPAPPRPAPPRLAPPLPNSPSETVMAEWLGARLPASCGRARDTQRSVACALRALIP
jgi:hypothetical protein